MLSLLATIKVAVNMKTQLANDHVDLESVFTDACRQRKQSFDSLNNLAIQAHEMLSQTLLLERADPDNSPNIKGFAILSDVFHSLSDSMSRFQANRLIFYKDLGFSLPSDSVSRILALKKVCAWLDSVPPDTLIFQNTQSLARIFNSIDSILKNTKGSELSKQLAAQFQGLETQLYYVETQLFDFCKSLKPPQN